MRSELRLWTLGSIASQDLGSGLLETVDEVTLARESFKNSLDHSSVSPCLCEKPKRSKMEFDDVPISCPS